MRNHKTNSSILHILSIKTAYHEGEIDLNYAEFGTIDTKIHTYYWPFDKISSKSTKITKFYQ